MLSTSALLVLALATPIQEDLGWHDLDLAQGSRLDLLHGKLAAEDVAPGEGWLEYENGYLLASPSLRALLVLEEVDDLAPFVRATGTRVHESEARPGRTFLFELGAGRWGSLRVLHSDPERCRLEWSMAPAGRETLRREPSSATAQATPVGTILDWSLGPEPDAAGASKDSGPPRWRVWRTRLLEPRAEPVLLAEVGEARFVDVEAPHGELVEYRIARTDAMGRPRSGLGTRVRAIPVEVPGEWPIQLEAGMRLDLLSGQSGGSHAHVEVVHPGPRTVQLRPIQGTRLSRPMPEAGPQWGVPDPAKAAYEPNLRGVMVGGEIVAQLPGGIFVRLLLEGEAGENAHLRRQFDLAGGRILPREPALPSVRWAGGTLNLSFAALALSEVSGDPAQVVRVIERERILGSDDWQAWHEFPADEPGIELDAGSEVDLIRLRYRHRLANGLLSLPSAPQRVLLGDPTHEPTRTRLIELAFEGLVSPDWRERTAARSILVELGPLAHERLVQALRSTDPEIQEAARELLLQTSPDPGDAVAAILKARAALEGIEGPAPENWLAPDANHRAWALLSFHHEADSTVDAAGWLRVLALGDPDPGVRSLAELALDGQPGHPSWSERRASPWAVLPREQRDMRRLPSFADLLYGSADPLRAMRSLREGIDPDQPRTALVTLEVAERLQIELERVTERAVDFEACSLALRLIDRYVSSGEGVLLTAAEALVDGPAVQLRALERFVRARLDQVPSASLGPALGRERILLAEPDYDQLAGTLEALAGRSDCEVDVVLPPGLYRPKAAGASVFLPAGVSGLRLIAAGPGVRIESGVRIEDAQDVVLDGLSIENGEGLALIGVSSRITLRDCRISGAEWDANLQSCFLELDGVHIARNEVEEGGVFSMRLSGKSQLVARESLLEGGGVVLMGPDARLYMERCVLDGGRRNALQSQHSGGIVLRDCLLRSQAAALFGAGQTLLEGVVVAVEGAFMQACEGPVRFCPLHHGLTGRALDLGGAEPLGGCPLLR